LESRDGFPIQSSDRPIIQLNPFQATLDHFQSKSDDVPPEDMNHSGQDDHDENQEDHESKLFKSRVVGEGHHDQESTENEDGRSGHGANHEPWWAWGRP
tara:strand:- start:252 stop:548 length:297 start_codon:yes stop_codon:yes gene_type:complete